MGELLWNLALCLFVLFMPVLLLGYTAEFVRQRASLQGAAGSLVLLNILLALSIIAVVLDKQISTLTTHATVGYILVGVAITTLIFSLLAMRAWKRIQARPQLLRMRFREEESTLSQSFLPH